MPLGFSLTPWLQPGEKCATIATNRFNGLSPATEAVETAVTHASDLFHRAEATVLLK
jgi:hypothetical protein